LDFFFVFDFFVILDFFVVLDFFLAGAFALVRGAGRRALAFFFAG
jgi:hypothetical protein